MDPASISSLGLGVASLAIQVFDGAVKGYEYFAIASNMPERYESLRLRLQIEYGRLLDWGEAAGIIENQEMFDKKMKVNGGTVMALLSEMRSLLKKMRTYSLRYEDMVGPLHQFEGQQRLQPIDTVQMEQYRAIFESKDIPKDKRKYPRGLNRLLELASGGKEIIKHPKRLRWATIDEKVFKEDLDRMGWLTNFLHETLGDSQAKLLMQTTRETYLAVLQLTKDIRQMRIVAEAAPKPDIADTEDGLTGSIFSQAEILVDCQSPLRFNDSMVVAGDESRKTTVFEQLAVFRAVNSSLYNDKEIFSLSATTIDQARDLTDRRQLEGSQRMVAVYQGKNVWVEWKSYERTDVVETDNDIVYQLSKKVRQDAERLVHLLRAKEKPAEFCVPNCVGYFDDSENDRFGFIYKVPDTALSTSEPRSLFQLLHGEPVPLKARIGLAQRLATCLLYLHAANWLHKALKSASVIFFNETEEPDIRNPYISSFEYSRPDKNEATSTGASEKPEFAVYCHPHYIGRPGYFRKSYDIYSLGMILLEIAYWKPAEEIFEINTGGSESVAQIRDWILLGDNSSGRPKYLEHVRNIMGDKYHNAVKACISGLDYFHLPREVDQTDPIIATLLQHAYLRLVVDVLDEITV